MIGGTGGVYHRLKMHSPLMAMSVCAALLSLFVLPPQGNAGIAHAAELEVVVTPLVGAAVTAKGVEISGGVLKIEGEAKGLKLVDVRRIEPKRTRKPVNVVKSAMPGSCEVRLVGGSILFASKVSIANDSVELVGTVAGDIKLAVEHVRSLRLGEATETAVIDQEERTPSAEMDKFVLRVDGKATVARGVLEQLNDEDAVFQFEGESKKVARKDLLAIIVAQASADNDASGCEVKFENGTALHGKLLQLGPTGVSVKVVGDQVLQVSGESLLSIRMFSSRVVMLSDKKPAAVVQRNIVALARVWQANRSIQGNPLRLGDESFAEGLGTSAYSSLAFELDGKFEKFAAVIGIDHETQGYGSCVFRVMGDGRELLQRVKRGSESGETIEVGVRGVKTLVLVVEPGEDLDLADHADWCDARVLRIAP